MATALVKSPTSASREDQERQQFGGGSGSSAFAQQQQQPEAEPEALQATRDMCAYCFGECFVDGFLGARVEEPSRMKRGVAFRVEG